MVQQAGKALNKPFKGRVQQGNKVQNFTYHDITIAKIQFILPSIIKFFTIKFDGDVNGARTWRCSMVNDTSHISIKFAKVVDLTIGGAFDFSSVHALPHDICPGRRSRFPHATPFK